MAPGSLLGWHVTIVAGQLEEEGVGSNKLRLRSAASERYMWAYFTACEKNKGVWKGSLSGGGLVRTVCGVACKQVGRRFRDYAIASRVHPST